MFATLTAPSFGPGHSRRMRGKTVLPPDEVIRDALRRLSDWLDHYEDQGGEGRR